MWGALGCTLTDLEYALFDVEPLDGTARDKNSTAAEEEAVDEEMPTTAYQGSGYQGIRA